MVGHFLPVSSFYGLYINYPLPNNPTSDLKMKTVGFPGMLISTSSSDGATTRKTNIDVFSTTRTSNPTHRQNSQYLPSRYICFSLVVSTVYKNSHRQIASLQQTLPDMWRVNNVIYVYHEIKNKLLNGQQLKISFLKVTNIMKKETERSLK